MPRQKPQLQPRSAVEPGGAHPEQLPVNERPQLAPEMEQQIRELAYQLYEQRGCQHGHHERDWIEAEAMILGRKEKLAA